MGTGWHLRYGQSPDFPLNKTLNKKKPPKGGLSKEPLPKGGWVKGSGESGFCSSAAALSVSSRMNLL